MSKLSLKIGTYFLILALCIETIAFVSFYKSISKMRIEEETLALLEKGNRYSNKITRRAKWSAHAQEKKNIERTEYNKNPNRPIYPDFDIADEAEHLVESESISNSDIAIIITDNNGKIISTSEPVTKAMQKQLTCKTEPIPQRRINCRKELEKIKIHYNGKPNSHNRVSRKVIYVIKNIFLRKHVT